MKLRQNYMQQYYLSKHLPYFYFFSSMSRMQPKCAVDLWKESKAKSVSLLWLFVTARLYDTEPNCKPKCPGSFTWQTQIMCTHTSADTMHYKAHIVSTYCTLISWTKHSLAHEHTNTEWKCFFLHLTKTSLSLFICDII